MKELCVIFYSDVPVYSRMALSSHFEREVYVNVYRCGKSCWLFLRNSCWFLCGICGPLVSKKLALCSSCAFLALVLQLVPECWLRAAGCSARDKWRLLISEQHTHRWLVITCYHSSACMQYCQILFLYVCHNKWRAWCW